MASNNPPNINAEKQRNETDRHLLGELVCPLTGGPLLYEKKSRELVSPGAKLAFPIRDGIPIMVQDEARDLSQEEIKKLADRKSR